MKKILYIIICLLLLPVVVYAKDEYIIDRLETNITVSDKEISYNDKISATLEDDRAIIQKKYNKLYYDGEKNVITNVIEKDGNNPITTNIEYAINLKKKNNDIVLSNDYNATINELTFKVTLNSEHKSIHFLLNGKDITNSAYLEYEFNNKTITGKYEGKLETNDELIITFADDESLYNALAYIGFITPIASLIIAYLLWLIYGKDLKNNNVKNTNVPDKNPIEVSYMYNGLTNKEDYLYMLIYLANNNAIKIKRVKNDYQIIKNEKYKTHNKIEKTFINRMFIEENTVNLSDLNKEGKLITELSIKDFAKKVKAIDYENKKVIKEVNLEQKYFEKRNLQRNIIIFLMAITLLTVTVIPFINIHRPELLAIPTIFSIFILYTIINIVGKNKLNVSIVNKIAILFCIIFIAWMVIVKPIDSTNILNAIAFLIGVISSLIMTIFYKYMPKRTKFGTKELSKIESLKNYVATIDTKDLEEKNKEDNNYMYDLLPYMYITGESEYLIEKIKKMDAKKPKWFDSKDFDIDTFNDVINKVTKSINSKQE